MRLTDIIHTVDAHAEGEPSRIVVGGVLDVPGETIADKRRHLEEHGDWLREYLLHEPRGQPSLAADVILPSRRADAGFVIMGAAGYYAMSGTSLIGAVTVLLETGMLPMIEPVTELVLESAAGLIAVSAECEDGSCRRVTFANVPAFVVELDVAIEVEGVGSVRADIAFGGEYFALVDAADLGFGIVPDEAADLGAIGERIRVAAAAQVRDDIRFAHFTGAPRAGGDGRSANVVPPGRIDRSPCGIGTSAKLAVLHRRGALDVGAPFVNESILSTTFDARIRSVTRVDSYEAVVPEISGRGWITGMHQFGRDPSDPIRTGFTLPDTWGRGAAAPPEATAPRSPA